MKDWQADSKTKQTTSKVWKNDITVRIYAFVYHLDGACYCSRYKREQ